MNDDFFAPSQLEWTLILVLPLVCTIAFSIFGYWAAHADFVSF